MSNDNTPITSEPVSADDEARELCADCDTILDNHDDPDLAICKSCEGRRAAEDGQGAPPVLAIFYIQECEGGVQGDDLDMFVEAQTADEAVRLWAAEWEKDLEDGEAPARVYQLRSSGKPGVLGWDTQNVERIR